MKSIKFAGCNLQIGKDQPQYNVLHAMVFPGPEAETLMCFELSPEEIEEVNRTKHIFASQLRFLNEHGHPNSFQPIKIFTDLTDIVPVEDDCCDMRGFDEIEAAHDTIQEALSNSEGMSEQDRQTLTVQKEALCWMLKHSNGFPFAQSITRLANKIAGRVNPHDANGQSIE